MKRTSSQFSFDPLLVCVSSPGLPEASQTREEGAAGGEPVIYHGAGKGTQQDLPGSPPSSTLELCHRQNKSAPSVLFTPQRSNILGHIWTSEDIWPASTCRDFIMEWAAVLEKRVQVRRGLHNVSARVL